MIKNFEEVKKQLADLSDVINKFKSEQVQLKIVELVFKGASASPDVELHPSQDDQAPQRRKRRRSASSGEPGPDAGNGKKRAGSKAKGSGVVSTLDQLIGDGYFAKPRTIGAIVEHCRDSLVRPFKPSDVSGPLGRFVRDKKLSRSKNTDGQFEYLKK